MGRSVTLVVVDGLGAPLGVVGPFAVGPWFQETAAVTAAAEAAGVRVSVLRMIDHDGPGGGDARAVYVAEALDPVPPHRLAPVPPGLQALATTDDPLRLPYARPGGNAADQAWAHVALAAVGRHVVATHQMRTWNLSCVHRLTLDDGTEAWLKVVPPFFRHEGPVIAALRRIDPAGLPRLVAHDATAGRVLLDGETGPVLHDADLASWLPIAVAHVHRQDRSASRLDDLLATGAPDWRAPALAAAVAALLARPDVRAGLTPAERSAVDAAAAEVPTRLGALATCGLPDTLVHGDLHPGNVVGTSAGPIVLDWGDAGVGHPLLDLPALLICFEGAERTAVQQAVAGAWSAARPGTDPERAIELITPVTAFRQALIYRTFLDNIEASEQHFHAADVPDWLLTAVRATGEHPLS